MKKVLVLFATLCACVLALSACGSSDSENDDREQEASQGLVGDDGPAGLGAADLEADVGTAGGAASTEEGRAGVASIGAAGEDGVAGQNGVAQATAGGAGEGVSSSNSISGSTQLSDITTAEQARAVCIKANESITAEDVAAVNRTDCTARAVLAERAGQGACEALRDQCIAAASTEGLSLTSDECTSAVGILRCEATVDEYIECARDLYLDAAKDYGHVTCESDLEELVNISVANTQTGSCQLFSQKCPEAFGN